MATKRHWLRDVIDFSDRPHWDCDGISSAPLEGCPDDCKRCNRAAQEIADSLALSGLDGDEADILVQSGRLELCAKAEVSY